MNRRQLKEAKKELLILQQATDNSYIYKNHQTQINALDAEIAKIKSSYGPYFIVIPVIFAVVWAIVIKPLMSNRSVGQPATQSAPSQK